jgi:ABC-type siderophore export system fused ATPase/permease subunit
MNDNESIVITLTVLFVALAAVAIIGILGVVIREKAAFENGYEQVALPGMASRAWQKAKP